MLPLLALLQEAGGFHQCVVRGREGADRPECGICAGPRSSCSNPPGGKKNKQKTQLNEAGWDITEAVNCGIAHKTNPGVFFLNPGGTACSHAGPSFPRSRRCVVAYHMGAKGVMEIWTTKDVKAGEEM
jgi:hypothetical protein